MDDRKRAMIERIIGNRSELWFFDHSRGWLVADLKRKRSYGTQVDVFEVPEFSRRELRLEEVLALAEAADWRVVLEAAPQQEDGFVEAYLRWRKHRKAAEEEQHQEQEATKRTLKEVFAKCESFTISDRHRLQLQLRGIEYKGVRTPEQTAEARRRRVARCWNCHSFLDNYQNFECLGCGWILCRCGACGCPSVRGLSQCPMCAAQFRQLENRGCDPYCCWECKSTALEAYGEYLRSPQWQQRRQARLSIDQHTCQDCGMPATDVHHRTYRNIGQEEADDLVSLCSTCHAIRHGTLVDRDLPVQLAELLKKR
jgi:hypothetical protein